MSWLNWHFWPFKRRESWSKDAAKFLELTVRSGLLSADDLERECGDFVSDRTSDTALDELSIHLVSKKVLTQWQCENLRSGKWKGFFYEGHCLLCQIGKDDKSAFYLCRDMETGKQMVMAVTPPTLSPDGKLSHIVRELTDVEIARYR